MASIQDIGIDIGKASPAAAATAYTLMGHSLNDWVAFATLGYIGVMIVLAIRKDKRERAAAKRAGDG